ncbi:MAG: NAD-dependent deacetylase [Kiritimatiellae bacterium]|nr:NAD-dependent deacetylase [Kiritimatiellia bacterium]
MASAKCVAAMTGAGISTLCGIPDFRGPKGLYRNPDAERIFDIDWFDRDPSVYYRGCRELVYGLGEFRPGPVHDALKRLEDAGRLDGIITQNIDMLHQKAGSSRVYEVHGSPLVHHCRRCGKSASFDEIMDMVSANGGASALGDPYVPRCPCGGAFKPDITFFGESLPEEAFMRSQELAARADLMLVLGTSLTVFPAAGLPRLTLHNGGRLVIVNAQPTPLDEYALVRLPDLLEFANAI